MLPPLAQPDQDFLEYFLVCRGDVAAIAEQSGAKSIAILAWMSRPEIAAYIAAERAARISHQRDDALAELHHLVKTHRDPTERRRAATTLLRATDPIRWRRLRRKTTSNLTNTAGTAPLDTPGDTTAAPLTDAAPADPHPADPARRDKPSHFEDTAHFEDQLDTPAELTDASPQPAPTPSDPDEAPTLAEAVAEAPTEHLAENLALEPRSDQNDDELNDEVQNEVDRPDDGLINIDDLDKGDVNDDDARDDVVWPPGSIPQSRTVCASNRAPPAPS